MVWVTERVARDGVTEQRRVRALLTEALSSFPEAPIDAERVLAAAGALHEAMRRWVALSPGEELVLEWREDRRSASGRPARARPTVFSSSNEKSEMLNSD